MNEASWPSLAKFDIGGILEAFMADAFTPKFDFGGIVGASAFMADAFTPKFDPWRDSHQPVWSSLQDARGTESKFNPFSQTDPALREFVASYITTLVTLKGVEFYLLDPVAGNYALDVFGIVSIALLLRKGVVWVLSRPGS
jgi:hypothetical protein